MLPAVIRWLGVGAHGKAEHRREQEAELAARNAAIRASRQHLEKIASERNLSRARPSTFLNARHDHRERLIPERSGRRTASSCVEGNDVSAGIDRGRARFPLRAAARRQDHRRIAAAVGTRPRSGRGRRSWRGAKARRRCKSSRISRVFSQRSAAPVLCFSGPGWPASRFPSPLNEGMERREAPGSLRGSLTDLARVRLHRTHGDIPVTGDRR